MKTTLLILACLTLSGCYDYYIASRTTDHVTQTDWLRGGRGSAWSHGPGREDSGQYHVWYQEWYGYEKTDSPTMDTGQRLGVVGRYFTDCPDYVLTCGIPEHLKRDR